MNLNRRSFIGGVIATAAAPQFPSPNAAATPRSSAPQGWLHRGLIDAGGTHEPYLFVVRRGGQRLDARQTSDFEQSEHLIKQLHDAGVEVFHTHLYKGFGMAAELEGMEETRRAVEIVHRHGMKADTYIQWNTMMYETFFLEEPTAQNWIQRDIAGLPILLTYGYQQSYRYRPCFANQEYIDYLKKIIRYAIVEVKTDFIHLDNFDLNAEPDSCHCQACVQGFRKRLRTKYSPAQLRERFGFDRVDFVNPPQWNSDNPPSKMQIIFDPAFQEWIDFRCQLMADGLEQIYRYANSLNPEVALEINPAGISGQNRSWASGVDHARLLKFTKAFWSEEEEPIGYRSDGRLVTRIRSYKLARAYSNTLLAYVENSPLALAEALTFNQTLGFVGSNPLSAVTQQYIEFYRQHRDNYEDTQDLCTVAVLRSYASLTYNNAVVQLSTVLAEQALIQSAIPFDLVFDEGLEDLSRYAVLVLPATECLSDRQISLLHTYVGGGGSLVVIGQSGLYDEWRRVRVTPGLASLVDHQESPSDYQERIEARADATGPAARKQVGRGRVAYLPELLFDGPLPAPQPYFAITSEFWKRPRNTSEFIELVRWAARQRGPLSIDAPTTVIAHLTTKGPNGPILLHLLNYDLASTTPAVQVSLKVPAGKQAAGINVVSPASRSTRSIDFKSEDGNALFTIAELNTYALVVVHF
jgi:hypothetical protein